ncbi:MAG TPA: hypothetical protein PKL78_13940, partial [Anaerolineales bacterium]|nr:hypothetical protein [Anaerolineales bacterium]
MAESTLPAPVTVPKKNLADSAVVRVGKYMLVRLVTMAVTVVIGLYLTILIANMGGYVDQIRRGEIRENTQIQVMNDPSLKSLTGEQRGALIEERIALEEKRLGLDQPFALRSFSFLKSAVVLDLGNLVGISGGL